MSIRGWRHIELKLEICIDITDLESIDASVRVCMQLQLQALAMDAHVREQLQPGSGDMSSRTPEHCLRMRIPCGGKLNLDLPRPQPIRRRPYT